MYPQVPLNSFYSFTTQSCNALFTMKQVNMECQNENLLHFKSNNGYSLRTQVTNFTCLFSLLEFTGEGNDKKLEGLGGMEWILQNTGESSYFYE